MFGDKMMSVAALPIFSWTSGPDLGTGKAHGIFILGVVLSIPILISYFLSWVAYHWTYRTQSGRRVPPKFPAIVPILGSTVPFLWDGAAFVKKATTYAGEVTCVRISLLVNCIYLFQDPVAVAAIWKDSNLSSPVFAYSIGLRYLFGMQEKAIKTYTADDSGPYRKPHPNSRVAPGSRIDFLTHDSLLRGLTGAAMTPTFQRVQKIFDRNLAEENIGQEWIEMPDLLTFFRKTLGRAVLEAHFGPSLLRINPGFIDDMWLFDEAVPGLAKRLPRFVIPDAYRVRDRLLMQIHNWYQYARQNFREDSVYADRDGDPFWGSAMSRERQKLLLSIDGQDDASVASTDLGLMWTAVTNIVPTTMMTVLHIFKDADLKSFVKSSIGDTLSSNNADPSIPMSIDMEKLMQKDLLQSVYAETLRLYVQAYVTRCSPHQDIAVGDKWWLPRNGVSMVSSYVSHMNVDFWNTQGGKHPLTSFWAERFLLDPCDPQSGPIKRDLREVNEPKANIIAAVGAGGFSMKGLSGAWIPYGGGYSACPGRLLAKRIILSTCARLLGEFDIIIHTTEFKMDSSGFGLGTQKPLGPVAFAIRRRARQGV
ncbi:cytochrome P450 [Phaeosphaeriaceae sp. PMI808]|nr:cytochrome P450 [Phaeosphaeriaceae sp. PMI808]